MNAATEVTPVPISLMDIGTSYTFKHKDDGLYRILFPDGEALLVVAGATYGEPGSRFDHPNVLVKKYEVQEFKHYCRSGRKFWTARPGVEFWFLLHKQVIQLVPEAGYSYVKILVAGKPFTLSVSGGTGSLGGDFPPGITWTDWVSQGSSICVGHSLRSLKHLASVALSPEVAAASGLRHTIREESNPEYFTRLAAEKDTLPVLKPGCKIVLGKSYQMGGSQGPFELKELNRKHRRLLCTDGYPFRVKYTQVDWIKTAQADGVALVEPITMSRIPKADPKPEQP
jgi:hypothetical protein